MGAVLAHEAHLATVEATVHHAPLAMPQEVRKATATIAQAHAAVSNLLIHRARLATAEAVAVFLRPRVAVASAVEVALAAEAVADSAAVADVALVVAAEVAEAADADSPHMIAEVLTAQQIPYAAGDPTAKARPPAISLKTSMGYSPTSYSITMKTRKYFCTLAALVVCGSMQAQDIYKVETLSGSDLNGTARFVGMGGAMNALGADISTMGSNPAAIGMYRRGDIAISGSATIQPNGESMADIDRARGSFDQAGFVYACKVGGKNLKYVNFGFNYQKRRNFKNYIGIDNAAVSEGMSQSWQMVDLAYYNNSWLDLDAGSSDYKYTTPLTVVGYDAQMIAPTRNESGKVTGYEPSYAQGYNYHRAQWGGIQQYDFNLSFNFQNQIYAGITFGVYDVNLHSRLDYGETLTDNSGATAAYNMQNEEYLTGTGFDIKLGLILRPIEDNPFRIGFSVSTPIFYDLTQNSYLWMRSPYSYEDNQGNSYESTEADTQVGDFDYRIRTPWKINLSMATTVGNWLALDAEYEVSCYNGAQIRYPDYDSYDYYYTSSTKDDAQAAEIDACLQAQHTFRIGAEAKLAKGVYGRLGYNYVSKAFKDDAFLNLFTDSPSYAYSTNTDYVNLGAINRVTAGLGVRGKHFYADVAYQYQAQKGDVFAYHLPADDGVTNRLKAQQVDLNRHNVLFTIGYKF